MLTTTAATAPAHYTSHIDPQFIERLSNHKNQYIAVTTAIGKVEGKLVNIAADHIQLTIDNARTIPIRLSQIVYFQDPPLAYW